MNDQGGGFSATMPVSPMGYGNGGFGGLGSGDGWWVILLLLCMGNGMWGGFGGGMWPMMMMGGLGGFGGWGMDALYPWLNNSQNINGGFRDQMLNTQVSSIGDKIASGFGDVQTALCGVNATVNGVGNSLSQQLNVNQMASMERSYNAQTANTQGLNAVQSQLAQCCCDNRLATESLRATVLQENCQDRYEAANNARDIIDNARANTQALLDSNQRLMDKMCQLELDGYKRENDNLRQQLNMSQLQASQTAQTAQILAGQSNAVNAAYERFRDCPVDSRPVYGNIPIFQCQPQNSGCGCGNGFING